MRLLKSIPLCDMTLVDLSLEIEAFLDQYGKDARVFWHSERFKTDCYLCIYLEDDDASAST